MSMHKSGPGRGNAMTMHVVKAKDFKGTLKRLLSYLKPRRISLIFVIIMAILSTTFLIIAPKRMGDATTKLFENFKDIIQGVPNASVDFKYIFNILLTLGILYVISALFSYFMQYIMASVVQKTVFDMREDVSNKLSRLPLKYYDSRTHGEILSRVTNDIDNISNTLQQSITQLLTALVTMIGVLVMMLTISPLMTLITLLTLPLSIIITKNIAKKSQKYFKKQQEIIGKLNGHVEEMYTGHKIIKAYGHERRSVDEFKEINDNLYEVGWKAQFISGVIMPLMNFVNNLGFVFICIAGGILTIKNSIKIGDIQAFIQYSRSFSQPIVQTANIANIIQATIASAERVFEVLDETEEIPDKQVTAIIKDLQGEVNFEHVDFGYKEDVTLINDMNIHVEKGQTIAIVGPTGAGKTTLVNLLMRFYELKAGKITIDGININDLKRSDLRNIFGMVLQDTWLFNGTIKDNIAYGKEGASDEEIYRAAKAAHVDHFVRTLPDGYDTVLNEEANNISQGQKQLLTIARAILADPSILILDEATSSVDTRTEIYIQKAMEVLMKGRTSFVIAHRLSTIKDADMILVMNNGDIIEKGNHEELLKINGFYADLYNSQFVGDEVV